jgi:lon-related putative ATP-dependent protease
LVVAVGGRGRRRYAREAPPPPAIGENPGIRCPRTCADIAHVANDPTMPMTSKPFSEYRVAPADLRQRSESLGIEFERSDQLSGRDSGLGQDRAVDALRFGIDIGSDGHNVFVLGRHGTHRHGLARELASEQAQKDPAPGDWCYVNNFAAPERPATLQFPAGRGSEFRDDMGDLIEELRLAIPAAFEGDDYRTQIKAVEAETQHELEALWKDLEERAEKEGIGILQTPTGYVLAPVRDGEVIGEEEFSSLPAEEREKVQATIQRLSDELQSHIERMPQLRKKHREKVKAINRQVTEHAVGVLIADLIRKYGEWPKVVAYLESVQNHIIDNSQDFHEQQRSPMPFLARDPSQAFGQYEVNLVVSNEAGATAPVVFEANPTYNNIIGKVEHRSEMGALVTDFRLIRSGALLEANGGYLILDMHRVLGRPFVWDALKQALFAKQVRIESPGETWGLVSTTTLKPEPIPLSVKVILIGERWLYYLLCEYDSEFSDLFKVAADLDDDLRRTDDNVAAFAYLLAERIGELELRPFGRDAVRRVIEQRARRAEDSERLSLHMRSLEDLLVQADYWAGARQADVVGEEDVVNAIRKIAHRMGRPQARIIDAIERDVLLIDTDGASVGQVNGLSVVSLGEYEFGHPVRITATTRMGSGKVVDIEREVELGGAIHSKGVMILSAMLSARYAREVPLALQGNIVFEQSYGGVEGDSASVGEFCALVSSISGIPVRQNIAVTGSVNQLGRVQVVGGINEKIEGFYDVCKARGLDGSHAVVIPRDNVKHLMLRDDVVEAVSEGRFTVYAVTRVDEAVSILTGVAAGERDADGAFPADTVNYRVEKELIRFAMVAKKFDSDSHDDESDDDNKTKSDDQKPDGDERV